MAVNSSMCVRAYPLHLELVFAILPVSQDMELSLLLPLSLGALDAFARARLIIYN